MTNNGSSNLVNAAATVSQLETSASQDDGVPRELEESILFAGRKLTQAAGILLRLDQETIASAIVLYTRIWVGSSGLSLRSSDAWMASAACTYTTAKISRVPKSPRSIINVYGYLESLPSLDFDDASLPEQDQESYYIPESRYYQEREQMFAYEAAMLRCLGYHLHVSLPHPLCILYLQALEVFHEPSGKSLAARAIQYLNTALLGPQLLYLTHQPNELATAAIYLAARDTKVKLPEVDWWEVFDCEREELGFLLVGMLSAVDFAVNEKEKSVGKLPMRALEVQDYIKSG